MIKRYRKKPVIIEAIQFTGDNTNEVLEWTGANSRLDGPLRTKLYVYTLEGDLHVSPGDYIIKGVKGEFYPCKPDIFDATYEEVFGENH